MTLTRFEWTRRARPVMEVGLGSSDIDDAAALWDVSLWDAPDSKWNGDEPLWRDVSCDVIDVHIEQGRGRVSDAYPVGTATVTVDNHTGWADPSTDDFEADSVPGYVTFDGGLGELTIPDAAALDLTGDFTMLIRVWLEVAPATSWEILRKWDALPGYGLQVFSNADVNLTISPDGAVTEDFTTTAQPPAVQSWRWFAFAFDADDGAAGHKGSWWYGGEDGDPFAWQLIGTTTTNPGVFSMNPTTSLLRLGGQNFNGRFGHVELRTGHGGLSGGNVQVGGTAVFKLDGWQLRDADVGASTLTATTGQTVTVVTSGASTPTVTPAVNPFSALLKLRPGRPIRVGVAHTILGDRWLYRGFIDAIEPKDAPDDWSTVSLRCIDALGEAGRAKLAATDVESGAGEQARTRFARILNLIRWPGSKRSISVSAIRTLYAAELDDQVVDMLRRTAESEGGWCFGDNQGRVVLKHRDWLYREQGGDVDATIGNVDAGAVLFTEDPPGSGLMAYLGDPSDWLEDAPDLMAWTGAP